MNKKVLNVCDLMFVEFKEVWKNFMIFIDLSTVSSIELCKSKRFRNSFSIDQVMKEITLSSLVLL